jgi:hypothetical protein
MRFVLVAVSLFVAWFAWWRCQTQDDGEEGRLEQQQQQEWGERHQQQRNLHGSKPRLQDSLAKQSAEPWSSRLLAVASTFLDMFSGR